MITCRCDHPVVLESSPYRSRAPYAPVNVVCTTCHGTGRELCLKEDKELKALIEKLEELKPFVPNNRAGRRLGR